MIQPDPRSSTAPAPSIINGSKISSSRIRLRATTASAVRRPPSRATTRMPINLLPGVAAREPSSKPTNQKVRSRKAPSIQSTCVISDLEANPIHSRSEEHTSELQSLIRNSYAECCFNKKTSIDYKPLEDSTKPPII